MATSQNNTKTTQNAADIARGAHLRVTKLEARIATLEARLDAMMAPELVMTEPVEWPTYTHVWPEQVPGDDCPF